MEKVSSPADRHLQRRDWIRAAIEQLRNGGIDAVRVDALCPQLGVTRGSFYWHFASREDLLHAVLADWESETPELIAIASTAATPYYRLLKFFSAAEASAHPPDAAIFAWARCDKEVARRVERIEQMRVDFFRAQIEMLGVPGREATRVAELLYAATLGFLERRARSTNRTASFGAFGRGMADLLLALLPQEADPGTRKQMRPAKGKRQK